MDFNHDFRDMLVALNEAEVDYLVVGAYAVAAHGYPRATGDLDIWVRANPQSAKKLLVALAVFGAFMLAVDKGALTFVLTAFRNLPNAEFAASKPAIEAIFMRGGWLWITWLFVVLPLGVILQMVGLMIEGTIPRWQGAVTIVGLLLLLNPDIEIISTVGALLMCAGLIPLGVRVVLEDHT